MKLSIKEAQAKTILSKSGLPDVDWTINPYTGCRFGCKYCYAAFVGRFRHPNEKWGSYVDVKINAPELLTKELTAKLKKTKSKDIGTILFSSVTDPYQGIEAKYQLTKKCLQVLIDHDYQGMVSILTKSDLVLRDIDLFKKLAHIEVGMTITSPGDPITSYLETYAPPHQSRLKALKKLHQAGINTYAFVGPLLPHLVYEPQKLDQLFSQVASTQVNFIYIEHLNLQKSIREPLFTYLKSDHPELLQKFAAAQSPKYRRLLDQLLKQLIAKYQLKVAHGQAIYHYDQK